MASKGLLQAEALIVLEHESSYDYPEHIPGFYRLRQAVYGETTISIYQYEAAGENVAEDGEEDQNESAN